MNNKNIHERNRRIITILGIFTIIFTFFGASLAYWNWQTSEEQRTNVVFTLTQDFSCAVDGGGDITSSNAVIVPTTCTNSEHAIMREVTVTPTINRNDLSIFMDLWIKVNSLDTGLKNSDNFKYAFTTSDESCTTGVISQGNLKSLNSGDTKTILSRNFSNSEPATYYLWVWLDAAETSTATMNQNFSLTLGGECTDSPVFVVPEGATYVDVSGEYEDGMECGSLPGTIYAAGSIVPDKPTTCDKYVYGDYDYYYNADESTMFDIPFVNTQINGWGVIYDGYNENPGEILTLINGENVISLNQTFMYSSIVTAPTIPSTIKTMYSAFYNCSNLTGTIEINANPNDYSAMFEGTAQPILLTGSSRMLYKLAETAENGNVNVAFVVPEGGIYKVGYVYDDITMGTQQCRYGSDIVVYNAGDIVDVKPTTCDLYIYDGLAYYYNMDGTEQGITSVTEYLNGWNVVVNDGSTLIGNILPSVNGEDVVGMNRFLNFYSNSVTTIGKIPYTIKYMGYAFSDSSITGTIEIDADPISYVNAFSGTTQPITLTGASTIKNELAATATNGNVMVEQVIADSVGQISGVWKFDYSVNTQSTMEADVQFISNNIEYIGIVIDEFGEIYYVEKDGGYNQAWWQGIAIWLDDVYRIVDFGDAQSVSVDFWNWFTASATKVAN